MSIEQAVRMPIPMPYITIQADLAQVIEEIRDQICLTEQIWISCYRPSIKPSSSQLQPRSTSSLHAKLTLSHPQISSTSLPNEIDRDRLPDLSAFPSDQIDCQWAHHATYSQPSLIVSCPSLSIPPTLVRFPSKTRVRIQPDGGIDCMDLTSQWILTGARKGHLRIDPWSSSPQLDSSTPEYRLGRGHVSDLTSCQFFPSGEVILTTSIDMSARIFSIHPDPAQPTPNHSGPVLLFNPRTLAAPHRRAVTSAVIIGQGKEILTACRDGKLRLWNVARSEVIGERTLSDVDSAVEVLAMKIGRKKYLDRLGDELSNDHDPSNPEPGQFVLLALSSGAFQILNLPSLRPIDLSWPEFCHSSTIDCIAISPSSDLMAYGTRFGIVCLVTLNWLPSSSSDDRGTESDEILSCSTLASWQRTTAGVSSLEFTPNGTSLLVAGSDGLPYRISVGSQPVVQEELAGYDCDPVTSIRSSSDLLKVVSAGKDGCLRIYDAPYLGS